jgi:(1->4)-alpha-D-glucan 1-alpha-D-glucosylmutase
MTDDAKDGRYPILSTYRVQLHKDFGFGAARDIAAYLDQLGITHLYCSPYLKAEKGSLHGYNVVDQRLLNPELGSDDDFRAFADAYVARKMGHIVDVVPNHMGISSGQNPFWNDVLENGPSSLFADYFDIDWNPPKRMLENRVLLPILGAQYGEVLENGEIQLAREGGSFVVRYYEHTLPVAPATMLPVLEDATHLTSLDASHPEQMEILSIATALRHLPLRSSTGQDDKVERAREKEVIKRRLAALVEQSPTVTRAIDAALERTNGKKGDARSYDRLDEVLRRQSYRLSSWQVAGEEINYRRFFDVNALAAIKMEESAVYDLAHGLLFRLVGEGRLDGFRLDHTDGLYDPAEYFRKLQASARTARATRIGNEAHDPEEDIFYLVAEKILLPGEKLPKGWKIEGTTGYDYLALASGLSVDPRAEAEMTAIYREYTGDNLGYEQHVHRAKRAIMRSSLASEVNMLAQALERFAGQSRRSVDFTLRGLTRAIVEVIAAFPVYRTYFREDGSREPNDERNVEQAIRRAKRSDHGMPPSIFDFLRDVLVLRPMGRLSPSERAMLLGFSLRLQQVTGPVMAKGVEDTAFYTFARMLTLNEVGGQPSRFGTKTEEFHAANSERRAHWPRGMTATSTHDTKRGEDVRATLGVLASMPAEWKAHVAAARALGDRHLTASDDEGTMPSSVDQYIFFQTVIGALGFGSGSGHAGADAPELVERIVAYMAKAAKEAKQSTSWINPDHDYDLALERFGRGMLADAEYRELVTGLSRRLAPHAATNSLAQVALRLASPGVADTYQGTEDWSFSLVDPDNRRPVDYPGLSARLARLDERAGTDAASRTKLAGELLETYADGDIKLYLTATALRFRREHEQLLLQGGYFPLQAGDHLVGFAREDGDLRLVCLVPRQSYTLCEGRTEMPLGEAWGEARIELPRTGEWTNVFTGETLMASGMIELKTVFRTLPVAWLLQRG